MSTANSGVRPGPSPLFFWRLYKYRCALLQWFYKNLSLYNLSILFLAEMTVLIAAAPFIVYKAISEVKKDSVVEAYFYFALNLNNIDQPPSPLFESRLNGGIQISLHESRSMLIALMYSFRNSVTQAPKILFRNPFYFF